ncbi:hypothetical protein [Arhodomonas sp. AD133]|uniref:hypothetical protein n=1 Tax=Arhodomonas sp. AD133 TaxID=3415009 RepID=UPI003EB873FB
MKSMEIAGVAGVIVIAVLVNGLIAKVEDESPGGIENPNGRWREVCSKPKAYQVVIWFFGVLVVFWLLYLWATK